MNTSQLECCIKCDTVLSASVVGVFAADSLPVHLPNQPFGLIVNTDRSFNPGRHWCAIYSDAHRHMEFFDSYGRVPEENSVFISRWLDNKAKTQDYNRRLLQSNQSTVCGLYCLLYLRQRLCGGSLDLFIQSFGTKLEINDEYVENIVSLAFPECVSNDRVYNQTCISLSPCI